MNPQDSTGTGAGAGAGAVKAVGRGRGPWRADQGVIELRRPQSVSSPPSVASSSSSSVVNVEVSDSLSLAVRSKLSVEAKEFVPKSYTCSTAVSDTTSNDYYGHQESNEYDSMTNDEWVIHHLSDVMDSVTRNPDQFDHLVIPLLDELIPILTTVKETLESALVTIINQAISERNFRYSGARLCNLLNNCQPENDSTFRQVLLDKLNDEYQKIKSSWEKNTDRLIGFVHFVGELYIQLELTKGDGIRIKVFGEALLEALKLLIQVPLVDNIKNTCDVLKLAGRLLDADHPDSMNDFFSQFTSLISDERGGTRVRDMISNILKLRSADWGHSPSPENPLIRNTIISESHVTNNDGVYYGPDHQALTAEEYKFLNESCEGDESVSVGDDSTVWDPDVNDTENAKIMAAFQEFVNQKP